MSVSDDRREPLPISLEFFPPKTPEGAAKLRAARQRCMRSSPSSAR